MDIRFYPCFIQNTAQKETFLLHGTSDGKQGPNFKRVRSPRKDFNVNQFHQTVYCVAWRAGTTTLLLLGS